MHSYPRAAVERMMKVQEVILRAMAKKITWWQAAEILGMSDRQMRRLHWRYREHGYEGVLDRRVGKPSPKRVPLAVVEQVLGLYQEKYFDLNVRHFHEKLREQHQIGLSYTWVKKALQGAGWCGENASAGCTGGGGERRPLPGMLLHIDGSRHRWFQDDRWYDLLVILDDATSEIYYAQLVEEESTMTVLRALREVIEREGISAHCTATAPVTSFGRLGRRESGCGTSDASGTSVAGLNIRMIPAYSPQARGRSERGFGTWQGRLPQELRLQGIVTLHTSQPVSAGALRGRVQSAVSGFGFAAGKAFLPCRRKDLEVVFSVQQPRVVNRDNTVVVGGKVFRLSRRVGGERWQDVRSRSANIWMKPGALRLRAAHRWADTTRKDGRGCASGNWIAGERLWKSRSVEK